MKTAELMFGWKIEYPESLTLLHNEDGIIALMDTQKMFGNIQSFVFSLSEKKITCQSNPEFIQRLTVSINKTIRVEILNNGESDGAAYSIGVINGN